MKRRNPPADDFVRARRWYHGTPKEFSAKEIMVHGIQPGDIVFPDVQARGLLKPVRGRVYLSPSPRYAIIYALGGDILGFAANEGSIERDGRFGYLFVLDGASLGDVEPDEDSVGEALSYALRMKPSLKWGQYDTDNPLYVGLKNDPSLAMALVSTAESVTTFGRLERVLNGEYAYWASVGKQVLRRLSPLDRIKLIRMGSSVSHRGTPLMPIESWVVDKGDSARLSTNGENWRQIFKRVELA